MMREGEESPTPQGTAQQTPSRVPAAETPQTPRWPAPSTLYQAPGYRSDYPGPRSGYTPAPPQASVPQETYRFRPLGERERQRIEERARSPYGPSYPYPSAGDSWPTEGQPAIGPPPTYGVDPTTRDPWMRTWDGGGTWGPERYGFQQPGPAQPNRDLGQRPYSSPPPRGDWPPPDPGPFQEPNQWGAIPPERTPPSYRMYPYLDLHRDRRITAR